MKMKCKNCGKELISQKKYCSNRCNALVNGSWKGILAVKIDKKNTSGFYDKNIQRLGGKTAHKKHPDLAKRMGILGAATCRKKKLGACFNTKINTQIHKKLKKEKKSAFYNPKLKIRICSIAGQAVHKKYPDLAKRMGKLAGESNVKNKTGCFCNPHLNRQIRMKTIKNIGQYKFKQCYFDSKGELEIARCIYYQLNIKLKERISCHFLIGLKEIDFFINNCFIEYHPAVWNYNKYHNDYYQKRRELLNKNGYKKYPLLVIK